MICEHTAQIDIRKLPKEARPVPEVVHFEGERLVTTWTCAAFGGQRQWWLSMMIRAMFSERRSPL